MTRLPATCAVRAAIGEDTAHGAVVPPLVHSSTFTFAGLGQPRTYDYTRSGNPTRSQLASALAELEGGCGAVVTSSGLAAVHLLLQLVPPGGRVLAPHDGYGGTWRLLQALARKDAFRVDFVDLTAPDALLDQGPADLLWIETPSNPLLRLTDLHQIIPRGRALGARVAVDNTFLSPLLQQPLLLGADAVIHSTTKYLNGHSDVVGGAVVARDPELLSELAWWANAMGITGSPGDAWLTMRGLRTLGVRMPQHERNAAALVELLRAHPAVERVYWPGLASHPGHDIARRQQRGFGAMVSFELRGGLPSVRRVVERLRCFCLAESLGGVESLVAHPSSMTHASMTPEAREIAGISDSLLRLSVGIEDARDLLADLQQALE